MVFVIFNLIENWKEMVVVIFSATEEHYFFLIQTFLSEKKIAKWNILVWNIIFSSAILLHSIRYQPTNRRRKIENYHISSMPPLFYIKILEIIWVLGNLGIQLFIYVYHFAALVYTVVTSSGQLWREHGAKKNCQRWCCLVFGSNKMSVILAGKSVSKCRRVKKEWIGLERRKLETEEVSEKEKRMR